MDSRPSLLEVYNHTEVAVKQQQFLVIAKHSVRQQCPMFHYPFSQTSTFAEEEILETEPIFKVNWSLKRFHFFSEVAIIQRNAPLRASGKGKSGEGAALILGAWAGVWKWSSWFLVGIKQAQTVTLNESKLQFVGERVPDCEPLSAWHFIGISWAKEVTYGRFWDFKQQRETALAKGVDACSCITLMATRLGPKRHLPFLRPWLPPLGRKPCVCYSRTWWRGLTPSHLSCFSLRSME